MNNFNFKKLGLLVITSAALAACGPELSADEQLDAESQTGVATQEQALQSDAMGRYYGYLSQAGFYNPAELGAEKEVVACDVRVQQGAGTFNRGETKDCIYQATEYGWALQSVSIEVLENKYGRGSYTQNTLAQDGQFNLNIQEIGDKWKVATDTAASVGDIEVKNKLDFEYQRHMQRVMSVSANKNTAHLQVTANGGAFRKSVIHVVMRARLVRVQ